jgi:hypothetical protein
VTTLVEIDGVDVTNLSLAGSSTRRLNRMSQAQVTLPMESAFGGTGSRLKITFDGVLHHHGIVMLCETEAGEDTGTTVYNSRDPLDIWSWRPCRDADGDYTKPAILRSTAEGGYGDQGAPIVIYNMMLNSENATASADPHPDGALLLEYDAGNFATGGTDVSGAPTDWPMTMADVASLLTSTGRLDIVVTPIDSGGNLGEINCYNGDYGTDRTGSVIFQYGMGARNIRALRHNEDATNVISWLRYLLGPRVLSSADPAGDQHWRTSVDGGTNVEDRCQFTTRMSDIESTYGGRFDIRIFDGDDISDAKELYYELYALEACIRSIPRELVHITPTRETEIGTFDIGDVITVEAAPVVRGGFSGEQRIYGYTIAWDGEDSVRYLDELVTSPDQEGLS